MQILSLLRAGQCFESGAKMIREQWKIENNYRDHCTTVMVEHLAALRAKANLTQEELSGLVGISRQTYYAYEAKKRALPWNTYLSLLLFFDTNVKTHSMLRDIGAYPMELMRRIERN